MDAAKKTILEALEKNKGIVSTACNAIGLPRRTFYDWLKADPEFKAAVDDVQEYTIDAVESKLLKKIDDDDITAIIFYMKTKGKKRGYVERQEFTGMDGNPLVPTVLVKMPEGTNIHLPSNTDGDDTRG